MRENTEKTLSSDDSESSDTKSENERPVWGGYTEYILSCVGYSVGIGNVWRFPYLAYKNGGGAFVVPYIFMVFTIGLPLFLIEFSLGQFSSLGPAHFYANLAPIFKGIGFACVTTGAVVCVYYNLLMSWPIFYSIETLRGQRWNHCNNTFNSPLCTTVKEIKEGKVNFSREIKLSTEEYFNNYILKKQDATMDDLGSLQPQTTLTYFIAWVMIAICLIKGIKSSGKVVFFTTTFPYLILVSLFIYGLTLEGSLEGIKFLITPKFDELTKISVWRDAAVQIFFSFGVAGGGMLTYASYNKFDAPVITSTLIVGFADMFTCLFSGLVIFTMIGFTAAQLKVPIDQIVDQGTGLAFIVIPNGISLLPYSVVWNLIYFLMLFMLGIDSQFAVCEIVTTYIFDTLKQNNIRYSKPLVVLIVSLIGFLVGLPLCFNGGIYIFTLLDHFTVGLPYLLMAFIQCILVVFVYDLKKFFQHIKWMIGHEIPKYLKIYLKVCLYIFCPIIVFLILVYQFYVNVYPERPFSYGKYIYPKWAVTLGWMTSVVPILFIPFYCVTYLIYSPKEHLRDKLKLGLTPTQLYWANSNKHLESENFS